MPVNWQINKLVVLVERKFDRGSILIKLSFEIDTGKFQNLKQLFVIFIKVRKGLVTGRSKVY